jgi:hypothetical protein
VATYSLDPAKRMAGGFSGEGSVDYSGRFAVQVERSVLIGYTFAL